MKKLNILLPLYPYIIPLLTTNVTIATIRTLIPDIEIAKAALALLIEVDGLGVSVAPPFVVLPLDMGYLVV